MHCARLRRFARASRRPRGSEKKVKKPVKKMKRKFEVFVTVPPAGEKYQIKKVKTQKTIIYLKINTAEKKEIKKAPAN